MKMRRRYPVWGEDDVQVEQQNSFYGNVQPIKMRLSDEQLMQMAVNAAQSIPWSTLHRDVMPPRTLWERKRATGNNVAMFTKTDDNRRNFAVFTVSELNCSLHELRELMLPPSADAYTELMNEIWGDEFKHGDILHAIIPVTEAQSQWDPQLTHRLVRSGCDSHAHLTLKHAVFDKPRLFSQNEEYFYLDLLKGFKDTGYSKRNVFTKTMLSLQPEQLLADASRHYQQVQLNGSIVCGLLLEEEPSGQMTRVRVYAEGSLGDRKKRSWLNKLMGNGSEAAFRALKNRVMDMTKAMNQLLILLQRRHLDLQQFTMTNSMLLFHRLKANQSQDNTRELDLMDLTSEERCRWQRACTPSDKPRSTFNGPAQASKQSFKSLNRPTSIWL